MPTDTPAPTSTSTVAPSPTTTPATARRFTLSFTSFSDEGALVARTFTNSLPRAWQIATNGLGHVSVVTDNADIRVVILSGRGLSSGSGRRVTLYTHRPTGEAVPLAELLHELGHAFGCCRGAGTVDGHWIDCQDRGLLCDVGIYQGTDRFSERELRALGLR